MPSVKTVLASAAILATGALAQSPAGFSPSALLNLGVSYNGSPLIPSEELPQATPDDYTPVVASAGLYLDTYMILLTDLSIPYDVTGYTEAQAETAVPGLGANRTTRLHWWQGNVTHNSLTGKFIYNSDVAVAPYAGPQPPAGDTFHDYVFWLFLQPRGFTAPAALSAEWQDVTSTARFNYSLPALVKQVGNPISANYMRVENSANAGAPTKASISSVFF